MERDRHDLRKRSLSGETAAPSAMPGDIDLRSSATLAYSSEQPSHPVDHLVDGCAGPGGTRWVSGRTDTAEQIVVEFDHPQTVSRLIYEVEEGERERTQEVRVEVSEDLGATYRQVVVQEYTFSPGGATFQREDLMLQREHVTHIRLTIVPNKRGSGAATLTSLRLFT